MTIKAVLTAALLAGSAMAAAAPPPPVSVPRVVTVPIAPPPVGASGCSAASSVEIPRSDWVMCIVRRNDWLYARFANLKTGQRDPDMQLEHGMIFSMLASTRLERLWPQLLDFVGPDGEKLRAALRRRAENALGGAPVRPRQDVQLDNFVSGSVLAVMQAAEFYAQAGDLKRARALIAEKRSEVESLGLEDEAMQFAWSSLLIRQAKLETYHSLPANALALYKEIEQNEQIPITIKANAYVNHAALLAKSGQGREALSMLEQAELGANSGPDQVTGSNRQFAWIRACALTLLGDKKGANKAIAIIRSAPRELRQASGGIASTESIEVQMAYCMGDDEALARLSRNPSDLLVDPASLVMQRGYATLRATDYATNRRVEQRFARSGYVPMVRQLPAGLIPALNYRRATAPQVSPPVTVPAAVGNKA